MGKFNYSNRYQKVYLHDMKGHEVHDKDCVPEERPRGSWTNGVKAWQKGEQGAPDIWVGWFSPPRLRNRNHHNRLGPNPRRNNQ
jgi:hypothetical protein